MRPLPPHSVDFASSDDGLKQLLAGRCQLSTKWSRFDCGKTVTSIGVRPDIALMVISLGLLHSWVWMFDRTQYIAILAGATGGAIAIASMEAFSIRDAFPLMAIPFATSIVTVLGSPKADPAQPRALIGGHLISSLVGLVIVKLCGPVAWAVPLAVGLSMIAMHLTNTFHPPARIDPIVVVVNDLSWSFLVVSVAIGAMLLKTQLELWS